MNSGGVDDHFVRAQDGTLMGDRNFALPSNHSPAELADAMNAWPKFAALGAIGPDLFFFMQDYEDPQVPCDEIMLAMSLAYFLDDEGRLDGDAYEALLLILAEISDTWAGILRFIVKLEKAWKKFMDVWNATIGPIMDKVDQVIDDLTGGLLSELGDAFEQLKNDIITIAAEEILTSADVMSWFALKMRRGIDEQSFLWSDMLHYRRTSNVPQRLFAHADELLASDNDLDKEHGQQLLAYAGGWVCHVATDVIAHSFVNEQAGGPFRTHWQRHHLVENHMDAFNYEMTNPARGVLPEDEKLAWKQTYESLNQSALYFAVQIPQKIDTLAPDEKEGDWRKDNLPEAVDRVTTQRRTDMLDTDGALPDWFADTIVRVLVETYANKDDGGLYTPDDSGIYPRNLMGQPFQDGLGDGATVIGHWLEVLGVDNAGMAMGDLRKAIARDTPAGLTVPPGFPLPWEVQATYRFLLSWFKRSYVSNFTMNKPQRPTVFVPPASDFIPQPPDFSGVDPSDPPLEQVCEAILAILDWIAKSLEQAAQAIADIVKAAASAATILLRDWIYDNITLPAWQVCENARQVLVHIAYLMPQSEARYDNGEIKRPNEIDVELVTLGHTVDSMFQAALKSAMDTLGDVDGFVTGVINVVIDGIDYVVPGAVDEVSAPDHLVTTPDLTLDKVRNPKSGDFPWLPVRETKTGKNSGRDVAEFRRPWAYPDRTNDPDDNLAGNYVETPTTIGGPYPFGIRPPTLLGLDGPAANNLRIDYEEACDPRVTDALNSKVIGNEPFTHGYPGPDSQRLGYSGTNPLGDPIIFSTYLLGQLANNGQYATNFNLDADRGFGYLAWDWVRGDGQQTNKRGQTYFTPVTFPEGADEWVVPDPTPADQHPAPRYPTPLRIHYIGRDCNEVPGTTGPLTHGPVGTHATDGGQP